MPNSYPVPSLQPAPATVLDTIGAAARVGVSPATMHTWRCTRAVEIPHARIGRRVVYRIADLDAFLAARVTGGAKG